MNIGLACEIRNALRAAGDHKYSQATPIDFKSSTTLARLVPQAKEGGGAPH